MSQRAFLEVKPEASAALDKIIGNSFPQALMYQTSLTRVSSSELSSDGKTQASNQDQSQVGDKLIHTYTAFSSVT
jgi:hypothetical protein